MRIARWSGKLGLVAILSLLCTSSCGTGTKSLPIYKVSVPALTYRPMYKPCTIVDTKTLEKEEAQCVLLYSPDFFELVTELKASCLASGGKPEDCQTVLPYAQDPPAEKKKDLKHPIQHVASIAFKDTIDCTVQGYVFALGGEVGFTQETCKNAVRFEHAGDSVILYSPHVWVRIQYPISGGHQRLQYQWKKDHAVINGKVVPIDWGYVMQS